MKSFSTVRDTQRDSQSYMEKKRGRREIEVTRRRRGGIKRGGVTQRREEEGRRLRWPGG